MCGQPLAEQRSRQPRSRADRIRDRLIEGVRPVRSLLRALVTLPWAGTDGNPVLAALHVLRVGYDADDMTLASTVALSLGRVTVDTALHLTPLGPEPEDPAVAKLRAALDRVVAVGEAMALDQVLVDADGVAAQLDLRLDPRAVILAGRAGGFRRTSRWPGWGNFNLENRGLPRI